jgi:hypothetical protein
LIISNITIYPNPYKPDRDNLNISFDITQRVKLIKIIIYTTGYRKIKQINFSSHIYYPGNIEVTVDNRYLQNLANGIYHVLIGVVNLKNEEILSKPHQLVILR